MRRIPTGVLTLALFVVAFALLFRNVVVKLVHDWATDDNYSHGFFIIPLAAYFVWERRRRLMDLPVRPSLMGLPVIVGSLGLLMAGTLGAELFISRVSMIGVLVGTVIFVLGWRHCLALAFPLAFLLLMIPIPAIIFNQIAFPLQLLASQAGEVVLRTLSIPVLREGNVMILANTTLEVAEACSGIRSLISLVTLGIVYGYFIDQRVWVRLLFVLTTVPIAIVSNAFRVAGTGVAAHYYGPAAAEGFFHTFSGWMVFIAAFALLFGMVRLIHWIWPNPGPAVSLGTTSPQVA